MANPWPDALQMEADVPSMWDQDTADQVVMVGRVMRPGIVNSVEFIPGWTRAGANTNFRTLSLVNRGKTGAGTTTIATLALTSGVDLTKFVAKVITITAANANIVVGDVLEWVSSPTGTGAPDPGGRVVVQWALGT